MFFEFFIDLGLKFLGFILDFLGVLPDMPNSVISQLNSFLNLIYTAVDVAAFFSPWGLMITLAGLAVAIEALVQAYHIILWTCKKIPFLAIE